MFFDDPKTILLVEDEVIIALAEKQQLEKNGLQVVVAHSGVAAIEVFDNDPSIDLVLMDIDLGDGIDGTQAAEQILSRKEIPIVFLTSHSEREMVKRVRGITRYGYILKNSGEFVLVEGIANAFDQFALHQKLVRSERRYRSMVETAPMPFQSLNRDGVIVDVNNAWLATLGYERDEVVGKWFGDLISPEQVSLFRDRFPIFMEQGHIDGVDFRMRHRNGSFIETIFNGCIAYSEDGEFSHTICIFQDVSDVRHILADRERSART